MAGTLRIVLGVTASFFIGVPALQAFHVCYGAGWPQPSVSYYFASPWPYYTCPPGPLVIPVPNTRPRTIYANPVPAPPSPPLPKKTEMPPAKSSNDARAPIITGTRALGNVPIASAEASSGDLCRVGFWNLSGREVTLKIGERTWTLPRDRSIRLDLQREFAWQVDQQPQHVERIADGQTTHELVIR